MVALTSVLVPKPVRRHAGAVGAATASHPAAAVLRSLSQSRQAGRWRIVQPRERRMVLYTSFPASVRKPTPVRFDIVFNHAKMTFPDQLV